MALAQVADGRDPDRSFVEGVIDRDTTIQADAIKNAIKRPTHPGKVDQGFAPPPDILDNAKRRARRIFGDQVVDIIQVELRRREINDASAQS